MNKESNSNRPVDDGDEQKVTESDDVDKKGLQVADTESYDDDDDDESSREGDEDEVEEEEEDEKVSGSFIDEVKEMWQQHLLAILVAIIATFLAHKHIMIDPSRRPSSVQILLEKHPFLLNYQRTANITFCGNAKVMKSIPKLPSDLAPFEFSLKHKSFGTLVRHMAADVLHDDKYEQVLDPERGDPAEALFDHEEYRCLQNQLGSSSTLDGHGFFYPTPTIASMYRSDIKTTTHKKRELEIEPITAAYLSFTGFAIKIVNLSREPILLYWRGETTRLVGEIGPYQALGTASQKSGQTFVVTDKNDEELTRWIVTADKQILYYDPKDKEKRTPEEQQRYNMHQLNQQYEIEYFVAAKRPWLAHFPRPLPVHFFWPAKYFGQKHTLYTLEGKAYKMIVASVTPRVFKIPGFLSGDECNEMIELAIKEGLKPSTLQAGGNTRVIQQRDASTRSSSNTWVPRASTELAEQIYRRAAQVLHMDEGLLQKQYDDDHATSAYEHSLAESLQVVRYKKGEEYTAHHDFVYPPTFSRHQPTRFATLLLYLNEDFEGGETVFPRAVNKEFHDGISIKPQQGMAVLFYNMLPDGNMDDLSQHASKPVTSGEKWLANLWVWEPHIY